MNVELLLYWAVPHMISYLIFSSGFFALIKYHAIYYRVGKVELIYNGLFGITFGIWTYSLLDRNRFLGDGMELGRAGILCFLLFPVCYACFVTKTHVEHERISRLQKLVFYYSVVSAIVLGVSFFMAGERFPGLLGIGYLHIIFIMLMAMPGVIIQKNRGVHGWVRIAARGILFYGMCLEAFCFYKGLGQYEGVPSRIAAGFYFLCYNVRLVQETGEMVQSHIDHSREQMELQRQLVINQINPHFIFNSLNCIIALSNKEPQEAREAVYTFSKYLRANFDALASNKLIRFEQELVQIQAYLKLQQKRFPQKINVEMDLECTDFLMPALTIQHFVESAVSYGLSRCRGEAKLYLQTLAYPHDARIQIKLKGNGFPTISERDREILTRRSKNVRLSLSKLPGAEIVWEWKQSGEGNVTITIPTDEKSIEEYENNNCG